MRGLKTIVIAHTDIVVEAAEQRLSRLHLSEAAVSRNVAGTAGNS